MFWKSSSSRAAEPWDQKPSVSLTPPSAPGMRNYSLTIITSAPTKVKQMMELKHLVDKTDGTSCTKELHKIQHLPDVWLLFLGTELKCGSYHDVIPSPSSQTTPPGSGGGAQPPQILISVKRNVEIKMWNQTLLFFYGKMCARFCFIICTITYTNASKVTQETSIK